MSKCDDIRGTVFQESDLCWRLRWSSQAWEGAEPLPQAAVYAAKVSSNIDNKCFLWKSDICPQAVLENNMYVIGGFSNGEHLDTLQIYDGQSWVVSEVKIHFFLAIIKSSIVPFRAASLLPDLARAPWPTLTTWWWWAAPGDS